MKVNTTFLARNLLKDVNTIYANNHSHSHSSYLCKIASTMYRHGFLDGRRDKEKEKISMNQNNLSNPMIPSTRLQPKYQFHHNHSLTKRLVYTRENGDGDERKK